MSHTDLPPDILALPIPERVDLAAKIWDSIGEDTSIGLTDADRVILDQRLSDHQQNPNQGVSWEELQKELRNGQ